MKRNFYQPFPLIFFLTAAYAVGVAIAYFNNFSLKHLALLILFSLLSWAACVNIKAGQKGYANALFPLMIFLLLGMFLTTIKVNLLKESLLKKLAEKHECVDVYGTVIGESNISGDYENFTLRVEQVKASTKSFNVSEFVKVTVEKEKENGFIPLNGGERVVISGVVPMTPSNESFKRYLYNQEIQTLIIADSSQLKVVDRASFIPRWLASIRKEVRKKGFKFLNQEEAGLLLGILLGDRGSISSLIQTNFAQAGVSHIIAVSGLHVGMMALICFWLARFFKLKTWNKYLLTIGFVLFYALITGCRPSVLRASLVIGIGILGWLMGKEKHLVASLSTAALILLIYNPFFFFDVAFQLSFGASLAIAILAPILEFQFSQFAIFSNRFLKLFLVSAAAQIGITPIIMYQFGELSVISAVANVFIVPLVAPILSLGLLANSLGFISSFLAYPVFKILGLLLTSVIKLASFFANLSFSSLSANMSLLTLFLYYLLLFVFVIYVRKRERAFNPRTLLFASLIVPIGLVWWQVLASVPPQEFTAAFFDVGQGDSAVIRTPGGACILIDGGQDLYKTKNLLFSEGVCKIDLLVLSHPHADHLNGLVEVVERYKIGLVLDGKFQIKSLKYKEFQAAICERQIPYLVAKERMRLKVGPDLKLLVLSDSNGVAQNSDLNNESLVAKVRYKNLSILFPGDVESEEELELADWKQELRSCILKVPHHGGSDSANLTFLKHVRPKVAIISVGKNNRFGHPASSTVDTLESLGAKIYRTDRDGNVKITSDGQNFVVSSSR